MTQHQTPEACVELLEFFYLKHRLRGLVRVGSYVTRRGVKFFRYVVTETKKDGRVVLTGRRGWCSASMLEGAPC